MIGSVADFTNDYDYENSRMTEVVQSEQSVQGANGVAAKHVDLTYNANGQFDRITRYASGTE
jgi:hypothetical protein